MSAKAGGTADTRDRASISGVEDRTLRICLAHIYADDNKGDLGIIYATIASLRRAAARRGYGAVEFDAVSMLEREAVRASEAHRFLNSAVSRIIPSTVGQHYRENRGLLRSVHKAVEFPVRAILTLAGLWLYRALGQRGNWLLSEEQRAMQGADLIVMKGGSLLYSDTTIRGHFFLFRLLLPILYAWLLGRPAAIFGQSIGPFRTRVSSAVASAVLRRTRGLWVREEISYNILRNMGLGEDRIHLVPDVVFSFSPASRASKAPSRGVAVGVTVKHLSFIEAEQLAYEANVATALSALMRHFREVNVVFLPQVVGPEDHQDDRIVQRRVSAALGSEFESRARSVERDLSPAELLDEYSQLSCLFATRLHSAIFASVGGVPAVVLEYQQSKALGTMQLLGLEDWVVSWKLPVEELTETLIRFFASREGIERQIKARLPAVAASVEAAAERIVQLAA